MGAKEPSGNNGPQQPQQQQPLAALDKILKQANGVRVDAIVDNKLASNVTNALNEMALNLRKLFMENRRLTSQVQEVIQQVQNVTGVNATSAIKTMQQQTANMSTFNTSNINLGNLMPRFN